MQIKGFKVWIIVIACVIALGLLLGADHLYTKMNVQQPLAKVYKNIIEVKNFELKDKGQSLEIVLYLNKTNSLQRTYNEINESTEKILGDKSFILTIKDDSSEQLEEIFSDGQLTIYESLVRGNFTEMAGRFEGLAEKEDAEAKVAMDERHIFVQIHKDDKYLYKVIQWQDQKAVLGSDKNVKGS